jgi:uncharacterized protein YbgA (DUF1722 family)/uncharacterized protein YbbK (DUF523 family)
MSTARHDGLDDEIRIGVSTCLLGEEVRHDGGHKHDRYITGTLARYFRFVPVCPEVEMGLGVPRKTLRLVREDDRVLMIEPATGRDRTAQMERFARRRVGQLERMDLCGYIFKKGSPSCGMERVRAYTPAGMPAQSTSGLFAAAIRARIPLLPTEEEGRLNDPHLREGFIERVFAYRRLKNLLRPRWTRRAVVAFQQREKLLLMAHSPAAQKELGRLVAAVDKLDRATFAQRYGTLFMQTMAKPATRGRHTNVLHHMFGYFHELLSPEERSLIVEAVEDFRRGIVPLVAPITLFRHLVRVHDVAYLADQSYLEPHPRELMLRNHA